MSDEKVCQKCGKVVDKLYVLPEGNYCNDCWEETVKDNNGSN